MGTSSVSYTHLDVYKRQLSNQEKDGEENYTGSDMKTRIKKKQSKRETEVQLDFFQKRYLR